VRSTPTGGRPSGRELDANTPASAPANFERLKVGDKVSHVKFGIGQIVTVIGDGSKEFYKVEFEGNGQKVLDPSFAKLIKLS